MTKKKGNTTKTVILSIMLVLIVAAGIVGYIFYNYAYAPNTNKSSLHDGYFYVQTGWKYDELFRALQDEKILKNPTGFNWLAKRKNLVNKVKPGRYKITEGMSNNNLVNMFRSGKQEPVKITFNNIRTKAQLAGKIGGRLEADSSSISEAFSDKEWLTSNGFTADNIISVFIPNTYELKWNTSANELMQRMLREYKKFWTEKRKALAAKIKLTPEQVIALASIVQEETHVEKEKPVVAGVYLNRVRKNIPLEADPTLKFALNDFAIKRLWNKDKKVESPYNTYLHKGIPPGPICIPDLSTIDAVLNHAHHDYIYFCAKPNFSGESNFTALLKEHNRNAKIYQKWLDEIGIKR